MSDGGILRFGAVGVGAFLRKTMAPAMKQEPNCDLVAVTSRDRAKAGAFAEEFGVAHTYTDYAAMLADPEVEAVYVATPNALHADQVATAARAGKHVLCEKPLALDRKGAERAVAACAAAGVHLGINFHNRYLPWVQDVSRRVREGEIGQVEMVELDVGSGPRRYDNWRADPELAGLGTVHNVGVHAFDFLRLLLQAEPMEVMAMFDRAPGSGGVEMLAVSILRFDNGTLAYCDCNERLLHPRNTIVLHGTRGRIVGRGLTRSRQAGEIHVLTPDEDIITPYPAVDAHRRRLAAFTLDVLEGRPPTPTGVDGLRSVELCEAISRSAREGRLVAVEYGAA